MSNSFTIRPAAPDDAEGINQHIRRIADEPNNMISYGRGEFKRTVDEEQSLIYQTLAAENSHMLVALHEDDIIGMCRCFGGVRVSRYTTGLGITVHRDWRNQGVGTALMQAMIAWAQDNPTIHRIEFTVYAHNDRAVHLYKKLGFQQEGLLKEAHFKDGQFVDVLLMAMLFFRPAI